jgi:effector-binding domain-containing protein
VEYEIRQRELEPVLALVHRTPVTMETVGDGIGGAFGVLMEHAAANAVTWAGPPFVLYPAVCEGEFEIAVCMPVVPGAAGGERATVEEVPGAPCASTLHRGPYSEVRHAYEALQKWMTDNGRRPAGMVREVYLNDPASVPPEDLLTEIDWPVA